MGAPNVVRKPLIVGALVAVIVVGAGSVAAWAYFSKKEDRSAASQSTTQTVKPASPSQSSNAAPAPASGTKTPAASPTTPGATPPPATTPASNKTVSITANAFDAKDITIKKGMSVAWINNDTANHAIATDEATGGPHSPQLKPGESYTFTFNQAGTFHYHCVLVPSLTGTVTVTN